MSSLRRLSLVFIMLSAQAATANIHLLHHLGESLVASDECSCESASRSALVEGQHRHGQSAPERDCRECVVCDATEDLATLARVSSSPIPVALTPTPAEFFDASVQSEPPKGADGVGGSPPSELHAATFPLLN